MKRKSLSDNQCPIARALDAIGDWWSLLIVREAFFGRRRFGEFQKSLGLAKNILTARLRKLVAGGILQIGPASDGSAYQEYVLTDRGRGLYTVLIALRQWGEACFYEPGELDNQVVDNLTSESISRLEIRSRDGRVLRPRDTRLAIMRQEAGGLRECSSLAISEGHDNPSR